MAGGMEIREVVKMQQAEANAKLVDLPAAPIATFRRPDMSSVGKGAATLAALADKGRTLVMQQIIKGMETDFHNGKLLYRQGKTLQELEKEGSSRATVAGFQSMQAARMVDDEYNASLLEIDSADKQLSPDQYREKLNAKFKSRLTGDSLLDDYLGRLSEGMDTKLVSAHIKAHTEWKVTETVNSATSLLASKSDMLDNDADKHIVDSVLSGPDSPLSVLSDEQRKKAVLDAVVVSLNNGSDGLLKHLGGVQGITKRYNPTAAELSAITKTEQQFVQEAQNKFNADYEQEAFSIRNGVRTGKYTYEQGVELAQAAVQRYGKGEASLVKSQAEIESASLERMRKMEADLERARRESEETAKFNARVQAGLASGSMWALDKKERQAAFGLAYDQIGKSVVADTEAGLVHPAQQGAEFAKRVAAFVDRVGVIDDSAADKFTAMMSSTSIIAPDGTVQPQALQAYTQLVSLYDVNPGLALRHLKSDAAKDMFIMARDFDMATGDDSPAALLMAAQAMRDDVGKARVEAMSERAGFRDTLTETVTTMIEKTTPAVIGGADRGSVWSVSDTEVQRAATDRQYLSTIERMTKANLLRNPRLTEEQAAQKAALDVQQRQAYVLGSMVVPKRGTMYEAMGIEEYTAETGAPHEAVYEYLKAAGPSLFGEAFFDDKIFGRGDGSLSGYFQSKWHEHGPRGVPMLDVTMVEQNNKEYFVVSPLRTDGSLGGSRMIEAKAIGEFYKQWRMKQVTTPVDTADIPWS